MNNLSITKVVIKEWYDGFVSGIVESDAGDYIGLLVFFEPSSGHRIYALLPLALGLSVDTASEMIEKMILNAESLSSHNLASFDNVRVAEGLIAKGTSVKVRPAHLVEIEEIKTLTLPVIDYAVDPVNQSKWCLAA